MQQHTVLGGLGRRGRLLLMLQMAALTFATAAVAQPNSFSYQGRLVDAGVAANGSYDFQFALFPASGISVGAQTILGVPVVNGIFSVQIDLGSFFFPGNDRFLEIRVKPAGSANPYVILSPRQPILSAPYAMRAGLADPASGSTNYIQNRTSQQPSANFNVSGSGTIGGDLNASTVSVSNSFDQGGVRILKGTGANTTLVGLEAGVGGTDNTHVGFHAGGSAFLDDTNDNTFVGSDAGGAISLGDQNTFVGSDAGDSNTVGASNTFVGRNAGTSNTTGGHNTTLGAGAQVGSDNLNYAAAIGADAVVFNSNSVVLGRATDTVRIPGNLIVTGTLANRSAQRMAALEEALRRHESTIAALQKLVASQKLALEVLSKKLATGSER